MHCFRRREWKHILDKPNGKRGALYSSPELLPVQVLGIPYRALCAIDSSANGEASIEM